MDKGTYLNGDSHSPAWRALTWYSKWTDLQETVTRMVSPSFGRVVTSVKSFIVHQGTGYTLISNHIRDKPTSALNLKSG